MLYPVSDAYIAAMRTPIREARQHCKLSLGIIDNTAAGDASYTWSDAVWGPDFSAIAGDGACRTSGIASFEHDYFRLDGKQMLISDDYSAHDYVSAALSGPNGVYATPPEITISFGVTHTLVGLSLGFGTDANDAPAQITFLWYSGETLISQSTVKFGQDYYQRVELDVLNANKLVVRYDTAKMEGRHARLCRLTYGIGYVFQDTQIISVSEKHTDAPVSTSLPTSSLSFNLDNAEGRFTADSNNSLVQFLAHQQKVTVSYGVDLPTGVEWVPGGVWYLSDWSSSGASASFSAVGRIELLTKTQYEKGVYDADFHYLSALARDVFSDAGLGESEYSVSNASLSSSFTHAPLPIQSHADELEILANLARCRLNASKKGVIRFSSSVLSPTFGKSTLQNAEAFSDNTGPASDEREEYATFEQDFFRLDGKQNLFGDDIASIVPGCALTGRHLSGSNGAFEHDMYYAVPFSGYTVDIKRVLLDFGTSIPERVDLWAIANGAYTPAKNLHPVKSKEYFSFVVDNCAALYVSFPKAKKQNQRAHLKSLYADAMIDFKLDESEAFDSLQPSLNTKLKDVSSSWVYISYYPSLTETLATSRLNTNSGWVRIEHECGYEPSMAVSVDDSAGVTVEQTHYAYVSYVRLTSATEKAVTVTITSNRMYRAEYPISSIVGDTGENLPLSNALFDGSPTVAVLDWVRDYYKNRVVYTMETKGYPELECGDFVQARDGSPAQIIETDLTYNGAFREKFKLRKKEG